MMKTNSLRTTLSGEVHNITGQTSLGLDPFDKQLFITLFTNFSALLHCGMYRLWYCIANIVINFFVLFGNNQLRRRQSTF